MKIRSKLATTVVLAVTAISASSCSSIVNPGGGDDTLTVYSNSVSDGRGDWLKEQAEKEGIKLQFVDLGGGDLYNRLVAEKANPQADVMFGLNEVYVRKLKEQDVLASDKPDWADKVDASEADSDGTFWPLIKEPIMMVQNDGAFPNKADAPKDWSSLWTDPAFKNRYEVPASLGGATNQMVMTSILNRNVDPQGKLGISDEGWKNLEMFYKNGNPAEQGVDLYARMKNGQVVAGPMWLTGKISREQQYGIKSSPIPSKDGIPILHGYISEIKGTKKQELAEKFINWFGSGEVQGEWSKKFGTAPSNSEAREKGDKQIVEFVDSFKQQDINWDFVAKNLDAWVEEATLKYLNQ